MGTLLALPAITYGVNKLIEINTQINGQWFTYLSGLIQLLLRRRRYKTNRIVIHDVWKDDVRHSGIIPFEHEWQYDCPSKVGLIVHLDKSNLTWDLINKDKSEDILIYGVNSLKQSLKIEIKYRVGFENNQNNNHRTAAISLKFDDSDGNHYTLEDESNVEHKNKEYRICGLGIEVLSPFRRKRIHYRGYLTKNGQQLVYVKFRFLCLTFGKVYDFTHDFDDSFMAKEWTQSPKRQYEQQFEDRFEQFCQLKGSFNVEDSPERIFYFWGSTSKKYLETKPIKRRIIRIVGFTKNGIGCDLGFVSNSNGFGYRFGFVFEQTGDFKRVKSLSLEKTQFEDLLSNNNISFKGMFAEKEYQFEIKNRNNSLAKDMTVNGNEGMCYILEENENEIQSKAIEKGIPKKDLSLVLGLNEENAKLVELTGGKGSSLAILMGLSQDLEKENYSNKFNVANGVVVTTNAYQKVLEEYEDLRKAIKQLEKSTDLSKDELKTNCNNLMDLISNQKLPEIIAKEIEDKLKQNFGNYENKLFAVRSSGASEDSEEMSAAGQMTTYLGVKGLQSIKESVMKCWSSQFSHIAYEYKRGYGQPINSPMAVVIQEMIACESAGVMFTCNPINGDERQIEITGNYGLGESVVSASSEPDTIRMSVNIESNSLTKRRTIGGILSKVIGSKKTLIRLGEDGGTVEEEVNDKQNCCISDDDLNRLGDIGLRIHHYYGNARDIEWGVKEGQIFMLQSRPVTNLDNSYTDYEIMHEMDSSHQTEFEIYSRAHWGENFPGSSSWLCVQWFWANRSGPLIRDQILEGKWTEHDYDPYGEIMGIQYNQIMNNLTNGKFVLFYEYPTTERSKQFILAFFGHHIEDEDVLNLFAQKRASAKTRISILKKIQTFFRFFYRIISGPTNLIKTINYYMNEKKFDIVRDMKKCSNSKQMFEKIMDSYYETSNNVVKNHGPVSMGSSVKNSFLRQILSGALANNPHLEDDFNLMISSCDEVISAEVPNYLREIGKLIENKRQFIELNDEEALKTLKEGKSEASRKFIEFLTRHGHRGYGELDPFHSPWRDNPIPCIKTIKAMLSGSEKQMETKVSKSVDEVISQLKTPLSFTRKLLIKKIFLPLSRKGVGYRELSKYFMIWMNDKSRQGFRYLARNMVSEGLIPTEDTLFYLNLSEIRSLCDRERDPMILMKARLRKRLHPKMNKYKFEEFLKGPEMKPRNFDEQIIPINLSSDFVQMKGTPVSNGTVKARVCVAEDITEADEIKSGDILITYSTDIGWSPYFTLLSGIITEIGGTISHGAVIAREYGIPSLIAVEGACRTFKTGDICVLDTKTATITKVE